MPRVNFGYWILGVEGLALLRGAFSRGKDRLNARVEELRRFLQRADEPPLSLETDVPEHPVESGYAEWSETYDSMPNPLIRLEEPVVRSIVDSLPVGDALDAACGTGRHARYLVGKGHRVVGVEPVPEMLGRAREAVPAATFREGTLTNLPMEDESFDLVVCALALTHLEEVGPAVKELARVLRPGGTMILSDLHPLMGATGGQALYLNASGEVGVVKSHVHFHGDYVDALVGTGLAIQRCVEPPLGEEEIALMSGDLSTFAPEAFREAFLGLPMAIVWQAIKE